MAERKRHLCGHCDEILSKTLYYKHKQLYYSHKEKKWCAERQVLSDTTSEEFSFDDHRYYTSGKTHYVGSSTVH